MKKMLYRAYVGLYKANLSLRKRRFQLYLRSRKAHLARADLSLLDLGGANLNGADLRKATLIQADLSRIRLRNAILFGADLSGARLHGVALADAQLTGANVTAAQLGVAKSLAGTTLPDSRPYAVGAVGLYPPGSAQEPGAPGQWPADEPSRDLRGADLRHAEPHCCNRWPSATSRRPDPTSSQQHCRNNQFRRLVFVSQGRR